jgi:plastocyanin
MRRASGVLIVAALAVVGLAACGGGNDNNDTTAASAPPATTAPAGGGGAAAGSTIDFSTPAGSDLAFDQKSATAKAGNDTISFDNRQSIPHDVTIEDSSGKELGATDLVASSTATATVSLTPGTYTFFCSVPGHREAGMVGTLTVK